MASSWDSVQIATLAVAALTPITVAGLGYFVARASRRLEQLRWANQTVVTRRLFAMYATTDGDAHLRAPIAGKWGDRRNMGWWQESMTSLFSPDKQVSLDQLQAAHEQLTQRFRADLYVTHEAQPIFTVEP